MMKNILAIISIFFLQFLFTQEAKFELVNCKPIKGDYLWAAQTEVTNFQYLEFLKAQKKSGNYNEMLPDTNCWKKNLNGDSYAKYYFSHPAYHDYPVVGLSKIQAEEFCKWLTKRLNTFYQANGKHPVDSLIVRLPTEEEWMLAARAGNKNSEYPWEYSDMRHEGKKYKGQLLANFVRGKGDYIGVVGKLNDKADVTAPVFSYWPNAFGLYNMSGNVAEMIQEEGRTKGGSWASRAVHLKITGEDEFKGFENPDSRIGFRYFIEIRSFKNMDLKPEKLSSKMIEKMLVSVPEGITFDLISNTEISNKLYNYYLRAEGKVKSTSNTNWNEVTSYPAIWSNDYDQNKEFQDYPVVNISYEEALSFCEWLTNTYNRFNKRKYENLKFRLPTEKEWEYAASGGLEIAPYPWGGPYLRNALGSFLCNHKTVYDKWVYEKEGKYLIDGLTKAELEEAAGLDGYKLLAPVITYHPNGYGLYNISGNVAEMIAEKGISKGGSWNSSKEKVMINSREKVEGASPFLGFRIVAEFGKELSLE